MRGHLNPDPSPLPRWVCLLVVGGLSAIGWVLGWEAGVWLYGWVIGL